MTDTVSDRSRRIWFRLAQAGAGVGLFILFMVDLYMSATYSGASARVGLAVLATAWLPALTWMLAHRLGPVPLAIAGFAVGGWSLVLTGGIGYSTDRAATFGLAEGAALLGLLLVVVRRSHPWLLVPGGGALVVAVGALPLRLGAQDIAFVLALLFCMIAFSVAAVGAYLRSLDSSRHRQVLLVQAKQRAELARDLHDFVAHHVTGIVVQAQGARLIVGQDPVRAEAALEQIERAGAEAMASMRRMVGVLRANGAEPDAPLAPLATAADIAPLVEGFGSAGSVQAYLHVEGQLDGLPTEIVSSAHRVVMEGLTNVRRHAHRATRVDVTLHRTRDWLLVRVADDGAGTGLPRGAAGFGLIGLTERMDALGGRIQAGSGPDGGWIVDASLPLNRTPAQTIH